MDRVVVVMAAEGRDGGDHDAEKKWGGGISEDDPGHSDVLVCG